MSREWLGAEGRTRTTSVMDPDCATESLASVPRPGSTSGAAAAPPGQVPASRVVPPPTPPAHLAPPPPPPDVLSKQRTVHQLAQLPLDEASDRRRREAEFLLFTAVPGSLVSAIVHLFALIGLGVYALANTDWGARQISIVVVEGQDDAPDESALEELVVDVPPVLPQVANEDNSDAKFWDNVLFGDTGKLVEDLPMALVGSLSPRSGSVASHGGGDSRSGFHVGADASGGLAYRAERRRKALSYGATPESENALDLGLEWLVRHQRSNGSWSFMHRKGDHHCPNCLCHNEGSSGAEHAATALALLALLGAGDTHLSGQYRDHVAAGLRFLIEHQHSDGSLMDPSGRMYSHGLAALALCEAMAMTRATSATPRTKPDSSKSNSDDAGITQDELFQAAQQAVRFVELAQHAGGGWRYQPGQAGDTSVVGWQMMALKSAQLSGINADPQVVQKATVFLDSVSDDRIGSCYGYTSGRSAQNVLVSGSIGATTPIGLLCRMYTGWDRRQPGLKLGVERLSRGARGGQGLYFYYYSTQVMYHFGGPEWERWDHWMRNYLVRSQKRSGSERGSWQFQGSFDNAGRVYCTALAVMTLEVYYRYSPIYGEVFDNGDPATGS